MGKEVFNQIQATYDLIKYLSETDRAHMFFPITTNEKSVVPIVPIEIDSLEDFLSFEPFKYEPFSENRF